LTIGAATTLALVAVAVWETRSFRPRPSTAAE